MQGSLENLVKSTHGDFGIEWRKRGHVLKACRTVGECNLYTEHALNAARFEAGCGSVVGEVYATKQPMLLGNVREAPPNFLRKAEALDEGLKSLLFVPTEDAGVLEVGFNRAVEDLLPFEVAGDVGEDHDAIIGSIPGIGRHLEKVTAIMQKMNYKSNVVRDADVRDRENADQWVPRDKRMNRLTGTHPFNAEAPLSVLRDHRFLTPPSLHYVRNHGVCPKLSWHSHAIEISGLVERPMRLTMEDLVTLPTVTMPATLNCAGNRRKEQNMLKKSQGFDWGCAAVSTVVWTGVLLKDVLKYVGIKDTACWVNFAGPKGEVPAGDTTYGASHSVAVCLSPTRPCMLAFMMNGELLPPDHGYPVRLLMPGYIGGRMIKWLSTITVTEKEGDNYYHIYDNRVFPKHITSKEVASQAQIWTDPAFTINDRNINSAVWKPAHCEKVEFVSSETYEISGYAYAGAGRPVNRVELTLNDGLSWRSAKIERSEEPDKFGHCWCWVFWSVHIALEELACAKEVAVRAWDDSQNCQPERPTWNLLGMMNNPWFRVRIHSLGSDEIWFEHPTQVDDRHSLPAEKREVVHKMKGGQLASPGWMELPRREPKGR
eukprot:TRINITY_DN18844_c0_g1_i2.p1 TRINITY_DN18844_c0_g1~~TRINITY_DN18844_c0_g1_i2.p1  ORF type:complete len:600 (-),score=110.60 TRINITY_DN18844_c0_g1_i2:556-2355(-)